MKAIETIGLSKTYSNGKKALDGLDISVDSGEIFSLLGVNGVGKTTLINILTTFIKPTSGNAFVMGKDVVKNADFVRTQVASIAQNISADSHLTLHENMLFQGRLYGLNKEHFKKLEQDLFDMFLLNEYAHQKTHTCSGGVKRRLDVAMSLLSEPKILFLDEPSVGMDVQSRHTMWNILKQLKEEFGITIFLTTHYLEEADYLSDTICFIDKGKKIIQDTPTKLRQYMQKNIIRAIFKSEDMALKFGSCLSEKHEIERFYCKGTSLYLQVANDINTALQKIGNIALQSPSCIGVEIVEPTLEDIFVEIMDNKKEDNYGDR